MILVSGGSNGHIERKYLHVAAVAVATNTENEDRNRSMRHRQDDFSVVVDSGKLMMVYSVGVSALESVLLAKRIEMRLSIATLKKSLTQ